MHILHHTWIPHLYLCIVNFPQIYPPYQIKKKKKSLECCSMHNTAERVFFVLFCFLFCFGFFNDCWVFVFHPHPLTLILFLGIYLSLQRLEKQRKKEAQSIPPPHLVWSVTTEQSRLWFVAFKGEFLLTAEVTIIELFIPPSCLCRWGEANSGTFWQSEQRACQRSLQIVTCLLSKLLLLASPPPLLPYLAEFSKAPAKLETIAFVHVAVPVTCLQWRH